MVVDDLMVKPMSSISSIVLLNNIEIKDISCLQEKTVKVDMDKGLKLFMKVFSKSTTVLTDQIKRSSGKFLRRFRLPENAKVEKVKASVENGMLTVTMPKVKEKKPEVKSIDISG
ncbi:17.4 kDa class I heat shock protein [Camellia lanceoleosa]|uniref:17.4 kDa class I heat shock protein n=1 Tax=Camellia lanceoleosa TaxID=1840588 RepID=A0ACC0F7I7_9ERIC|nr:17.4 kDa class I heat shock protein [Camellia lanceoleosa]